MESRAKNDLLMSANSEGLITYMAHLSSGNTPGTERSDGVFRMQLPEGDPGLIPKEQRVVSPPVVTTRLEEVAVDGSIVKVTASVRTPEFDGVPDYLGIRARRRATDLVLDLSTTYSEVGPNAGSFFIEGKQDKLPRGSWDMYCVLRFGEFEKEYRLGKRRAGTIEPEGVNNLGINPAPRDRILAYFTQAGNLSVDAGSMLHKGLARAGALGLMLDENGRVLLLVQTTREPETQDEYFGYLDEPRQHGGRLLLPSIRLGPRTVGLRLPLNRQMIGATFRVVSVLGGAQAPLAMSGTEFWSARAAGFDLVPAAEGGITVTAPSPSAYRPQRKQRGSKLASKGAPRALRWMRHRVAAAVHAIPVLGPGVVRLVRRVRGGRR